MSKRLKVTPTPQVHIRKSAVLTRAQFHAMCVEIVVRKDQHGKQRINEHASRELWRHFVAGKAPQPAKKKLYADVMKIVDEIEDIEITAASLPFYRKGEKEWQLPNGTSLQAPETGQVEKIVGVISVDTGSLKYEVK